MKSQEELHIRKSDYAGSPGFFNFIGFPVFKDREQDGPQICT